MTTHYQTLDVGPRATPDEIRQAYHRLSRRHHPDRPTGSTATFQAIQKAYGVLSDPLQRHDYDHSTNFLPQVRTPVVDTYERDRQAAFERYKQEGLAFTLPKNIDQLNCYEYYNALFGLVGSARIGPGMDLSSNEFYFKVDYVHNILWDASPHSIRDYLFSSFRARKQQAINEDHMKRFYFLKEIIFHPRDAHSLRLYNLSINHITTSDDQAIINEAGGIAALQTAVKGSSAFFSLDFAYSTVKLHEAGLLNPRNFKKIVNYPHDISDRLSCLKSYHLLTQTNFDLMLGYLTYWPEFLVGGSVFSNLAGGLGALYRAHNLTQTNFEHILRAQQRAAQVGHSLAALHLFRLETEETRHVALHLIPNKTLPEKLKGLQAKGQLNTPQIDTLHHPLPDSWKKLGGRINELFAHALFLLTINPSQGETTMLLALELKASLVQFTQLPESEQNNQKIAFKTAFVQTLHSKDEVMHIHRDHWKVLITNILIALSGIGLFALGVNYLLTKHCFFAKTNREQYVDNVESLVNSHCVK